jgi:hypothetical protein
MVNAPLTNNIDEEITYCAVHTDKEATLRCIRCDRYMCSQCIVQSPVGYICRECARRHDDKFYNAASSDPAVIFLVCAALTGIGAGIISATGFPIFFLLIFGLPVGGFIGTMALRATQKRRGRNSQWVGVIGCLVGGVAGIAIQSAIYYQQVLSETIEQARRAGVLEQFSRYDSMGEFVMARLTSDFTIWIFIGMCALGVYWRYRGRI